MGKSFEEMAANDPGNKYLARQHSFDRTLVFITYGGRVEGVVEEIQKYHLKLKGREELLSKIEILFWYKLDAEEHIGHIENTNGEVQMKNLKPARKIRERLGIRGPDLYEKMKKKEKIIATMRNGRVFRGKIKTFGIFSICLGIGKGHRVIIMRSNIYALDYGPAPKPAEVCRGNVKTGVFHFAGCRYFGYDVCTAVFGSPEEAVKAGFRPHKQCSTGSQVKAVAVKPDEHAVLKEKSGQSLNNSVIVRKKSQNDEGKEKVKGNLSVTIKISQLPRNTESEKNDMIRFVIDAAGRDVQVALRPKAWNRIVEASKTFPQWVAAITGNMGADIKGGFVLENPAVQVFEKKPRPPKE